MARRDPRDARVLGLWTAAWLAVFLIAGLLWVGDLSVQWPVLLVPLLWALVAARPRRAPPVDPWTSPAERTDTVERPALRRPDRNRRP